MYNQQQLIEKWSPLLDAEGVDPIKDSHRRATTAVLLENQERFLREQAAFESGTSMLTESPTNSGNAAGASGAFGSDSTHAGPTAGFDPVLISLIRRSMPNLVAYELAGVQPMNGPTGLIFAMRSRYTNQSGTEAFFDEPDSAFSANVAVALPPKATTLALPMTVWLLVSVLPLLSVAPTPLSWKAPLLMLFKLSTALVKVWRLATLKLWVTATAPTSTRWHSRSRRSPLTLSPVL